MFVSERSAQAGNPTRLTRFGADHLIRQLRTDATTEPVTVERVETIPPRDVLTVGLRLRELVGLRFVADPAPLDPG